MYVILTAFSTQTVKKYLQSLGVSYCYDKPISIHALRALYEESQN